MKRLAATAIVLLFSGSSSPSANPAFDCSKAKTAAVKTICANDDLGRLDVLVNQAYAPAISQENTRNKAVTLDKAFLARVIACGAQHECIRAEQVNFISEMIALVSQPSGDLQQLPLEEPAEDGAPSAPRVEGTQQAAVAPIVAAVQEPAPVVTPQPATDVSPSTHPAPIAPTDAECDRTCAANQVTLAQQEFDRTNALVARGFATQELLDQRRQALNAAIAALNTPPPPAPIAHPAPTGSAVYAPAPAAPAYAGNDAIKTNPDGSLNLGAVPQISPTPRLPPVSRLVRGQTASTDAYNWICTLPSDVDQAFALWHGGQTVAEVEATVDCVKLPAGEKAIAMDSIDGVGFGSEDLVKVKLLGAYKNTVGWASATGWVQ